MSIRWLALRNSEGRMKLLWSEYYYSSLTGTGGVNCWRPGTIKTHMRCWVSCSDLQRYYLQGRRGGQKPKSWQIVSMWRYVFVRCAMPIVNVPNRSTYRCANSTYTTTNMLSRYHIILHTCGDSVTFRGAGASGRRHLSFGAGRLDSRSYHVCS